jgi:exonuclease VII small subunit
VELSRSCIQTLKEAEVRITEIKKKLDKIKTEDAEFLE